LDTENANYSYGSLQKILEIGLTKVDLNAVEKILLLGMGGGSVIHSLRNTFEYSKNIVAVEIDPEVIKLAKEEFDIITSKKLQIIEDDAFQFVKNSTEKFQLIIIDLFIDTNVPPIFYGKEFCENVANSIQSNGSFIFNVGMNLKKNSNTLESVTSYFGDNFKLQILPKVNGTNTLIVGQKLMQ
jgi:spermidine synthase